MVNKTVWEWRNLKSLWNSLIFLDEEHNRLFAGIIRLWDIYLRVIYRPQRTPLVQSGLFKVHGRSFRARYLFASCLLATAAHLGLSQVYVRWTEWTLVTRYLLATVAYLRISQADVGAIVVQNLLASYFLVKAAHVGQRWKRYNCALDGSTHFFSQVKFIQGRVSPW